MNQLSQTFLFFFSNICASITRAEYEELMRRTLEGASHIAQLKSALDRIDQQLLSGPSRLSGLSRLSSPNRQSPLRGGGSSRRVFVEEEQVPDGVNSSVTRRWL